MGKRIGERVNMSDFAKLHTSILEAAKENLKRAGNLAPVGILCNEKTRAISTIPFQWQTDNERAKNIAALGATAFLTGADYVFIVHDMFIGGVEDVERGIRLSEKPMDDRREGAFVMGVEMGDVFSHTPRIAEYRRSGPDQKTITFLEEKKFDTRTDFTEDIPRWFMDGYKMAKSNAENPEEESLVCEHGRRKGAPCLKCLNQPKAPDGPAS